MSKGINYGRLMHKALRQLISDVLAHVAKNGLPGQHHFYITFDTTHPGVDMAASLKQRYPAEMTIVMQDWFEDLAVMKERFSVTLNFGDVPEPIVIPFEAIKTFVDPSVEFGLRFDAHEEAQEGERPGEGAAPGAGKAARDEAEGSGGNNWDGDDPDQPPPSGRGERGEAEVVRLDKFRKH